MKIKILHQQITEDKFEFEQRCNNRIKSLKKQYEIMDIKFSTTLDHRISSNIYSSVMVLYMEVE